MDARERSGRKTSGEEGEEGEGLHIHRLSFVRVIDYRSENTGRTLPGEWFFPVQ